MQGSFSQPDLCLYFSTVQALKAHQAATRPLTPETPAAASEPVVSTPGRSVLRPRWLAWLATGSTQES